MGNKVGGRGEIGFIGCNQWNVVVIGDGNEAFFRRPFLLHAVALQLDVETVAEELLEAERQCFRVHMLALHQFSIEWT